MKTIKIENNDKEILSQMLSVSSDGMTVSDIRQSIKVIDKIDLCKNNLELEDADYEFVIQRLHKTKFAKADKELVMFFDRIENPK